MPRARRSPRIILEVSPDRLGILRYAVNQHAEKKEREALLAKHLRDPLYRTYKKEAKEAREASDFLEAAAQKFCKEVQEMFPEQIKKAPAAKCQTCGGKGWLGRGKVWDSRMPDCPACNTVRDDRGTSR